MRVLRTSVEVEVVDDLAAETILRKHTLDSHPQKLCRPLPEDFGRCSEALAAGVAGVADIHSVGHLLASESHLVSVDDDDVVTTVKVRGE